jgi:hypothetical protein
MNINDMTYDDFLNIPRGDWNEEIRCDCFVVIPAKDDEELHDSGYRCMSFVAVKNNEPICLISGYSDVIHIDGIGGFGYNWLEKYNTCPKSVPPTGWNVDCLPKSGLLRFFTMHKGIILGKSISSMEVYSQ